MLIDVPKFRESSSLLRYVEPEHRGRNNRPKVGAYRRKEDEDHLSVNSDEVETENQIAATFAAKFHGGSRPVSISGPTVADYNAAAESVGMSVSFDAAKGCWVFGRGGDRSEAYKHRPKSGNRSHCGVEYIRTFDDLSDFKFAVRMARSATYRLV